MPSSRLLNVVLMVTLCIGFLPPLVAAENQSDEIAVRNWDAPPYWNPSQQGTSHGESHGVLTSGRQSMAAGATALPFTALFPCRLVDTRAPAFPAPLGGGFLPPATVRSYTLTGVCGLPANAKAVSLNATVVKPTGPGFLTLWPEGGAFPPVSTLNYLGNDVIVNAAVVPLSATGGISIALGVSGGDVILDTNGFYADVPSVTSLNSLTGDLSLAAGANVTLTPAGNTLTIASTASGGPPTGSAGGSLTGTYPSPGIAAGAVGASQIANGAVGLAQINTSQVQARGSSTCPSGSAISTLNADGSVVCTVSAAQPGFSMTTLQSAGSVGRFSSITIGADGLGLISFSDDTNSDLRVAHCSDVACTTATVSTLDSAGNVGSYTSIVIGADGFGLISYRDYTNNYLKVAHCENVLCTTATTSVLDTSGNTGWSTSLALGADGLGLIAYLETSGSSLRVAHCSNASCTNATLTTVASGFHVGYSPAVAIGADGLGLISYLDDTTYKVVHCTNVTCAAFGTPSAFDSASAFGPELHTAITTGSDGLGLIVYAAVGAARVAHCNNLACTSVSTSSPIAFASFTEFYPSITVGPDGLGLVAFGPNLSVAHCANASCTSASVSVLDSFGISTTGLQASITIGADGMGLISHYIVPAADLKVVHCSNPLCTPYVRRR